MFMNRRFLAGVIGIAPRRAVRRATPRPARCARRGVRTLRPESRFPEARLHLSSAAVRRDPTGRPTLPPFDAMDDARLHEPRSRSPALLVSSRRDAEAAFERARARAGPFALVCVSGRGADRGRGRLGLDLLASAEAALERGRVLLFEVERGCVVAVTDFDSGQSVEDLARTLLESARQDGSALSSHAPLNVGLAHNGDPRRDASEVTFETLLAVALEGERVASAGGGDR